MKNIIPFCAIVIAAMSCNPVGSNYVTIKKAMAQNTQYIFIKFTSLYQTRMMIKIYCVFLLVANKISSS
jgi:hypothetical protein